MTTLHEVRGAIARAVLGVTCAPSDAQLGHVTLYRHQVDAATRIRSLFAQFGGALLADEVGLGKTFVAAALAREARAPLIVAPASLRGMWERALAAAELRVPIVSIESLSRGTLPVGHADLVIVDEAHHARNPATRRYAALAQITYGARVLLLTATPVHNSPRDLAALLALFLGARAHSLDAAQRAACIVRRGASNAAAAESPRVPTVGSINWIHLTEDDRLARAIVELPPPVPPSDGGAARALVAWTLLRQWASSDGALHAALRRRLATAIALESALEQGRHLARGELASWISSTDAVQLGFPELSTPAQGDAGALLDAVRTHADGIRALVPLVRPPSVRDDERAARLREIRARHPGESIVAFSHSADTVTSLYRALARDAMVAALTANGATCAGGALTRTEALARFAPNAQGAHAPAVAERITLLLATDLLSEGVNLQDASVVVHLDLPWTPARMEQRVGRAARMGARHERVTVYAYAPPASAETRLAIEQRLRAKLAAAARGAGVAGAIRPLWGFDAPTRSAPEIAESIRHQLQCWRSQAAEDEAADARHSAILITCARSSRRGWLAAVQLGERVELVGAIDDHPATDEPGIIAAVVAEATNAREIEHASQCDAANRARAELSAWCAHRAAAAIAGVTTLPTVRARRAVITRIAAISRRTPYHRRASLAPLADAALRAAELPAGVGAERVLRELAHAPLPDDAWLRAVGAFADAQHSSAPSGAPRPLALLVLVT